jgi:hypothetical protein
MDRITHLEQELFRTKRHVRWLSLGTALILSGGVLAWTGAMGSVMAQAQPEARVIRAQRFVVEDGSGATRAILAVTPEGPGLALYRGSIPHHDPSITIPRSRSHHHGQAPRLRPLPFRPARIPLRAGAR